MPLHKSSEVTSSVCTPLAILSTVIRLFVRRLIFWFDDVCALLSMFFLTAHMGIIISLTPSTFAAYYTLISVMFYCTLWLARLSILLTIIRINPTQQKRPFIAVVILFVVLPAGLIGQIFWVCNPQKGRCKMGQQVAIFKLVSDVIADLFLLATSLHFFLVIQDKILRFRLSCLFSTCVFTTIVSIVDSSFILNSEGTKVIVVAIVECCVSLISANIPALSSVLIVAERTSHRANRGVLTSIPQFVQHTETQASEIPIPDTTDTLIIKTLSATDVMTQEQHHDPESNLDDGESTYGVEIS